MSKKSKTNRGGILIVDDDRQMAHLLAHRMEREGYAPKAVFNSEDALRLAETGSFQIVLTDYRMPDMDGLALTRLLRELPGGPIVIMITGYGNLDIGSKAIRAGAYDFIEKPVDFNRLLVVIKHAAAHRKLQRKVRVSRILMWLMCALIPLWIFAGIGLWSWFHR